MAEYKTKLDLRIFDDTTTQTTLLPALSPEMKIYYERELIEMAEGKLVHDQFGDKYPIPRGGGKQIEFRKYAPLDKALVPLDEGVTPKGGNLRVTAIIAEISQYGDWTRLSDMLELTAIDNNILQATKLHGSQAGRTLDTITREILNGGTQVQYAPKIVGGVETEVLSRGALNQNCKLTPDLFFRAAAELETMNAETIDDSYVAIIHPLAAYDLMRNEEWINVHQYAQPENIYKGEIGMIGNVRFVRTSEAKVFQNDTCPGGATNSTGRYGVFSTLVLGARAYGVTEVEGGGLEVIVKQKGYGEDPLSQRSSVGWKATKTAERLVEEYMIRIESLSAYSDRVFPK